MADPVIKIVKEEAVWRVSFGEADNHVFVSRAEALAAALGRAATADLVQVIEVDPPAGGRTLIVGDNGAARMDWLT
jgi:hypothetical protein